MGSGAMGTVRASPKRSEGPKGRRWNRPRGAAGIAKQARLRCSVKRVFEKGIKRHEKFKAVKANQERGVYIIRLAAN